MNIKITKEEAQKLFDRETERHVVGSHLYGCNNENSDKDILVIYKSFDSFIDSSFTPPHQFQFTEDNIDYIFTTRGQFLRNLYSGDSTINADLCLFSKTFDPDNKRVAYVRSYNIIKAYIGFAKRDIKMIGNSLKDKKFHAQRSLYTASCLMKGEMPDINIISNMKLHRLHTDALKSLESSYRQKCNKMFEERELECYPQAAWEAENLDPLHLKLLNSLNTREFRYDD
jgi:predicted nucleotidyltransferase